MANRVIPEFPNYSINHHGEVYNHALGHPVAVSKSKKDGLYWVQLFSGGQVYNRGIRKLMTEIFPEIPQMPVERGPAESKKGFQPKKPKEEPLPLSEYVSIPGHSEYGISRSRRVYDFRKHRELTIYSNAGSLGVRLRVGDGHKVISLRKLWRSVFE